MESSVKYKYRYRPAYNAHDLLIEFINGAENENLLTDLFEAIKEINPVFTGKTDLWMNDEVLYFIGTDLGEFILSKDIWDFAFIVTEKNQECIARINDLLLKDKRYEKIEVNFDDYTTRKKS
ncbi:MAG: hypothetical protein IAF38_06640 [Bacteroidia bacterium]|nr:hypothetical protein [Bacteroidia bacterium]